VIVYLIRHGERDTTRDYFNPALNHQDNPLTAKGVQQAKRLGGYLLAAILRNRKVTHDKDASGIHGPI
jgi:broad specificity phosphatase PhoE